MFIEILMWLTAGTVITTTINRVIQRMMKVQEEMNRNAINKDIISYLAMYEWEDYWIDVLLPVCGSPLLFNIHKTYESIHQSSVFDEWNEVILAIKMFSSAFHQIMLETILNYPNCGFFPLCI